MMKLTKSGFFIVMILCVVSIIPIVKSAILSYGANPSQTLDFYNNTLHPKTFIIVIHGGGWDSSDKDAFTEHAKWFSTLGFPTANINYRLVPEGVYPRQVDDVLLAMEFLNQTYGAEQFILYGHSSGAHLAMLVTLAENNAHSFGIEADYSSPILTAIGTSGPYNYTRLSGERLDQYQNFTNITYNEDANVVNFADSSDPKVLILAGEDDNFVPWISSSDLNNSLNNSLYYLIPGYGHNDVIKPFSVSLPAVQYIKQFLDEFFDNDAPTIDFVAPTSSDGSSQSVVYVNISSNDSYHHYTFLDFDNSLLLFMRMDDVNPTNDPVDLSSYSYTSIANGATQTEAGKFAYGFNFDGINDNIDIPDIIEGLSELTVSAWVKSNIAFSNENQIILDQTGAGEGVILFHRDNREKFVFQARNDTNGSSAESSIFNDTNWHHVVGVYNSTNLMIYVDGVLNGTGNLTGVLEPDGGSNLVIGTNQQFNSWNGTIDEVLIFNRALSQQEILALYNASANQYYNNFVSLVDGIHTFKGHVVDILGNRNQTEQRSVATDSTILLINFIPPTPEDLEEITTDYVTINVSANHELSTCILHSEYYKKKVSTPYIWVASYYNQSVTRIDTATGQSETYHVGDIIAAPRGIAIDSHNNIWVALWGGKIAKLNASGEILGTYSLIQFGCGMPKEAAIDSYNNVWVACFDYNYLIKLNNAGELIGRYSVDPLGVGSELLGGIAIDSYNNVWVPTTYIDVGPEYNVTKLNNSGSVIGIYDPGPYPSLMTLIGGVAIDSYNNIWVVARSSSVIKLNNSGSVIGVSGGVSGGLARGIAIDSFNNVWVTDINTDSVLKINNSGAVIGLYYAGSSPKGIAVDSYNNIWVVNRDDNNVTKFDNDGSVIGTYSVGDSPDGTGDMTGFALQYFVLNYSLTEEMINENYTMAAYDTFSDYTISGLLEGINYTYWVECNDSAGNYGQSSNRSFIYYLKDATAPTINFIPPTPEDLEEITTDYVTINVSASENVSECILVWDPPSEVKKDFTGKVAELIYLSLIRRPFSIGYIIDNFIQRFLLQEIKYSAEEGKVIINYTMETYSADADTTASYTVTNLIGGINYTYWVGCNDSVGDYVQTTSRNLTYRDTTPPIIEIISPLNQTYNTTTIDFNVTINENGTCLYSLTEGTVNYSMSTSDNKNFSAARDLADGNYNVSFYCKDDFDNWNSTIMGFGVEVPFSISFVPPTPEDLEEITTDYVTINVSASENVSECVLLVGRPLEGILNPYVWVPDFYNDSVIKFDAATGGIVGIYPVKNGPEAVAIDPFNNAWLATYNDNKANLTKLNNTGEFIGTYSISSIYASGSPQGVAADIRGDIFASVNSLGDYVIKINGSTGGSIGFRSLPGGGFLYGVAVDAFNNVWVTSMQGDSVTKVNSSNLSDVSSYSVGDMPVDVAVDAFNNVWVINTGSKTVTKLNATTGSVIGTYSPGGLGSPRGIAIDSFNNVWICLFSPNITKLNGTTGGFIGEYVVGPSCGDIAVDAFNNVWVVSYNNVTKLNNTGGVIETYYVKETGSGGEYSGDMTGFAFQHFILDYPFFDDYTMEVHKADADTIASYAIDGLTQDTYTFSVGCRNDFGKGNERSWRTFTYSGGEPAPNDCVDSDADDYGVGDTSQCPNPEIDCNDNNPNVHPGATETCNGIDDNCVGGVDEGGASLCDDGISCTVNSCNGISGCSYDEDNPYNPVCDDGLFCNDLELCSIAARDCISGTPIDCTGFDSYTCTDDLCNEEIGSYSCKSVANDSMCTPPEECIADKGVDCGLPPTCDGVSLEPGEDCDGSDLGNESCISQDYPAGGVLSCSDCSFNYSECSSLPAYSGFDGATTNFALETDLTSVQNAVLERTQYGMINFTGHTINFERLDLENYVIIEDKTIGIDISRAGMTRLNVSASLGFYNISFVQPVILRDGLACSEEVCNITSYNITAHVFEANVLGFSNYTVVENLYCGDGSCNNGETCGSCSQDCGNCQDGGGGGGGGGGTQTYQCNDNLDNDLDGLIDYPNDTGCSSATDNSELSFAGIAGECIESWTCGDFGECINKTQTRTCEDENNCSTNERIPSLEQDCESEGRIIIGEIRWDIVAAVFIMILALAVLIIFIVLLIRRKELRKKREELIENMRDSDVNW